MFVYIYILYVLVRPPRAHAHMPRAQCIIQFNEKTQWFNSRKKYNGTMDQERDQRLQSRRERERASETAEKKEDWLRMPNILPVETSDRSRGPADSCCQGLGRPDSSL